MKQSAKLYASAMIAGGALVLAATVSQLHLPASSLTMAFLAAVLVASIVKVRLPGIQGTYSLSCVLAVFGIAYLTFAETVIGVSAGAVVQSLWRPRRRPSLIQVLFNVSNLAISVGACFFATHLLAGVGLIRFQPAVLVFAAALFFVTNTSLTSVMLALLEGKPLPEVCGKWFLWPASYFLAGTALVGLAPMGGRSSEPVSWIFVLALLYLLHFFHGLSVNPQNGIGEKDFSSEVPGHASFYIWTVATLGLALLALGALYWQSRDPLRFAAYFLGTTVASTWKVRLPGMTSTVSVSFVLIIVAIAEFQFSEIAVLSAVAALVQSLWRPKTAPRPMQVVFNIACHVISAGLAFAVGRLLVPYEMRSSLIKSLAPITLVLYGTNTALVAGVLCLIAQKPLSKIWENCSFWTFPYYLVGAAAAGLMITAIRIAGWAESFFILPAMVLVYISYRLHLRPAVQPAAR